MGKVPRPPEGGSRTEALWGGAGKSDGTGHNHVATNDGVNASYLRERGEVVVDDNPSSSTYTGYDMPTADEMEKIQRDQARRNRRGRRY